MRRPAGCGPTAIEVLVVLAVVLMLTVVLLPNVLGGGPVYELADQFSLRWHYRAIQAYKVKMGHYPARGGHKFVLAPWVEGCVAKSLENRDRYFSANVSADAYRDELITRRVEDLWPSYEQVNSEDTHFAGRGQRFLQGDLARPGEIWMATDNEGFAVYEDAVFALYGDGSLRQLLRRKELKQWWPEAPEEGWAFPVGPESPHPDLRELDY